MELYFSFFSSFFVIIMTLFVIIFIFLTMHPIIPFKMDENWEKEDIPTDAFREYLRFSFPIIIQMGIIVVLGLTFLFFDNRGFFADTIFSIFLPIFNYGIAFITFLAFSSIAGIISYFWLPGQISYAITIVLFIFILLLILL